MKQDTISSRTGLPKISLSGPDSLADASKYVSYFEQFMAPFYKNPWLSHEQRATMLDNLMVAWIQYQRLILTEQSPSFYQHCVNEGYIR